MAPTMKRPAAFAGFTRVKPAADFPAAGDDHHEAPADVLREIQAEQVRQRETLTAILRLLERARGPRDQADAALLVAVAEGLGDRQFTSAQLMAHAHADPALRDALQAADITNAQELGCLFRRLVGMTVNGFQLERVDDQRTGVRWRVQVCEG